MPYIDRIGVSDEEPELSTGLGPESLSFAGETFWDFMQDRVVAIGNEPRALIRSQLIVAFRQNLRELGPEVDKCMMEEDHGYIQWLFPLETVGVNPKAPVTKPHDHKILSADNDFKARMLQHFLLFTEFMGINYDASTGSFKKTNAKQWSNWILNPHNNLRITRILISLKNFGLPQVARDFLRFLENEYQITEPVEADGQIFMPFSTVTRNSCENFWRKTL